MKQGNIVGEPFDQYVNEQIKQRQKVHGSGLEGNRTSKQLQYLNSKTSWVKMASSVIVNPPPSQNTSFESAILTSEDGTFRLQELGLNPDEYQGYKLASKSILFNGLQEFNYRDVGFKGSNAEDRLIDSTVGGTFQNRTPKSGVSKSNSLFNNSAYGFGGTEFGLQPMPGITGIDVKHLNRGSIRKATVTLKAYNKFQFDLIEILYLRLGFTMMLEWGNSHYIENSSGGIETIGNTLIEDFWFNSLSSGKTHLEVLQEINKYREKYDGNYDGFFGKVSNFSWNFNTDGSYDITIDLVSLGDVIESLNINILTDPSPSSDSNQNKNVIEDFLNNILKQSNPLGESEKKSIFNSTPDSSDYLSIYEIKNKETNRQTLLQTVSTGDDLDLNKYSYIRLGAFLRFINSYVLPVYSNGNTSFSICDIDTDEISNAMAIYPNQFAIDPGICLIRSTYFNPPSDSKFSFFTPMAPFYQKDPTPHGKIMNIYLNFKFIKDTLNNNLDSKGNLNLFKYIKSICDGINKSLGSVNNLEPVIDEDRNTLVILEQNNIPNKDQLRKYIKKELKEKQNIKIEEEVEEPEILNIYGYNPTNSTSNFIQNFSVKTEIGPDLATMMTIGATAEGSVVGEDATAFSKWNKGLTDRYKSNISNAPQPQFTSKSKKEKESELNTLEKVANFASTSIEFIFTAPFKEIKAKEEQRIKLLNSNIEAYLNSIFSTEYRKNSTEKYEYFEYNSDYIAQGYNAFKSYFNSKSNSNPNIITSTVGFIPLKLTLTLDGISGIKIYQKLKVNTKFLPQNYPDILEFLAMRVNHKVQDNKWTTEIETISQPIVKEVPIEDETLFTEDTEIFQGEITDIFSSPIDVPFLSTIPIRNDSGGKGFYGADRGSRSHDGVDIKTSIGQPIYAPISGRAVFTRTKENANLLGVKIFGNGLYQGYTIWSFYTQPAIQDGTQVEAGDLIGYASDLSEDYSESVTDHIHLRTHKNGKSINPQNLKYLTSDGQTVMIT